jgi:hypothetical protein
MEAQLPLPAGWARNFVGAPDPRERLDALMRDRDDAKAEIRLILDRLADRYDVPARDVDLAMLSVDDSIGDLIYDIERGLHREIEGEEPF